MYVYNKNLICYRICFSTSFILDLYFILVYLCFYDLIFSIVLRFIFIIILFCEFYLNLTTCTHVDNVIICIIIIPAFIINSGNRERLSEYMDIALEQ